MVLSSAIKRDAFIPYKKSCFYNMKSLKSEKVFYFAYSCWPVDTPDNISIRSISEVGQDHVKVYPHFFSFEILSQKSNLWFPSFSTCTGLFPILSISVENHAVWSQYLLYL